MKRILAIVLVVALFLVSLVVWYTRNEPSVAQADTERQTTAVQKGDIVSSISATGNLEAENEIELSFESNGMVKDVYVIVGQEVKAGQKLAQLDTTSLELAVANAETSLEQAKTELTQTQKNVDPDDLTSARAALASAQAKYDALLAGSSEDEITVAAADLKKAEVELQVRQTNYDRVSYRAGISGMEEAEALMEATIAHASALASYNEAIKGADDADLKSAQAQIVSAQSTLNNLLKGASDQEIRLAENAVKAAQLSLDNALRDVESATLLAPDDAVVTAVNIQKGERTSQNEDADAAIVLTDLTPLHIDVEIDEIDVTSVELGQAVIVKVDALPDNPLSGVVSDIAPAPVSVDGGVVTYEVVVTLNTQNENARPGMTANVTIETERREGILLIPASVVQVDEATAQTFVEKRGPDGMAIRTAVTLGSRSDQMVEIVSGLQEGDQAFVPLVTAEAARPSGTSNAGGPGIGFGGTMRR